MNRIFLILMLSMGTLSAQKKPNQLSARADQLYRDSNYTDAEEYYRKANAINPDFNSQYNIGNSLYQQGRFSEAKLAYERAASQKDAVDHKKAMAHYNLGNTQMNLQKYESAIDNYKESLRIQPNDQATKINLAKALQLQKIQQQQQQQQQGDQNQPNKNSEQNQKKPNDPQDQENKADNQHQKNQNNQQESEHNGTQQEKPMSQQEETDNKSGLKKQEAEQILKMIDAKDKKIKEKLQNVRKKSSNKDKDW